MLVSTNGRSTKFRLSGWSLALAAFAVATVIQFGLLKRLAYSSCLLDGAVVSDVVAGESSSFSVGSIVWDVDQYAQDARPEPFRQFFVGSCPGQRGAGAAACVSATLAKNFPAGAEFVDFCSRDYDPRVALTRHLSGAPGHCMQRSGLMATTLLSAGVPARVMQVIAVNESGHTLVEVWDSEDGWVMVDPSVGSLVGTSGGPSSAYAALTSGKPVKTWRVHDLPRTATLPDQRYNTEFIQFNGNVLYPEPWLYLRTGARFSSWPTRGRYAVLGPMTYRLGIGQRIYQTGILVSVFGGIVCFFKIAFARWRVRARPLAAATQRP